MRMSSHSLSSLIVARSSTLANNWVYMIWRACKPLASPKAGVADCGVPLAVLGGQCALVWQVTRVLSNGVAHYKLQDTVTIADVKILWVQSLGDWYALPFKFVGGLHLQASGSPAAGASGCYCLPTLEETLHTWQVAALQC